MFLVAVLQVSSGVIGSLPVGIYEIVHIPHKRLLLGIGPGQGLSHKLLLRYPGIEAKAMNPVSSVLSDSGHLCGSPVAYC